MSNYIFPVLGAIKTPRRTKFSDLDFKRNTETDQTSINEHVLVKVCLVNKIKPPKFDYSHTDQLYITAIIGNWYYCNKKKTGEINSDYEAIIKEVETDNV